MPSNQDQNEEEPKKNSGADKQKFEKVVDELRNVLAGLDKSSSEDPVHAKPPSPELPAASPSPADDSFLRASASTAMPLQEEPEKLGEAAFRQAAGLGTTPPPSDQDFWNGNVLGWPAGSSPVEEPKNGAASVPLQPIEPPAFPPIAEEKPTFKPSAPSASLEDRLWMENQGAEGFPQVFSSKPESTSEPVSDFPPRPPKSDSVPSFPKFEEFDLPPMPAPPARSEAKEENKVGDSGLIFESFAAGDDSSSAPLPPTFMTGEASIKKTPVEPEKDEEAPQPSRTVLPANLRIPVPGTLHQLPSEKKTKAKDETLAEMEIHHAAVFGVACFYPEGHQAAAEDFMRRLKAGLAASSHEKKLEAVLMTPWTSGQINPHAWKKAASLSGANILFVLSARKEKDLFKELTRVIHKDEVPARLIFVEQVPMRALYADLLADLVRSFDVKG